MVKCFCFSALCFNNFTSKDCNRRPLKYYRLIREVSLQSKHRKIFRIGGMNQNKGDICSAHWGHEETKSINNLPAYLLQKI